MNRNYTLIFLALLTVFIGYYYLYSKNEIPTNTDRHLSQAKKNDTSNEKPRFSKILKKSKKEFKVLKINKTEEIEENLNSKCSLLKKELSQNTLSEFVSLASEGKVGLQKNCKKFINENDRIWADSFFKHCNYKSEYFHKQACESVAFYIKASVMYEQIKNKSIHNYTDEELIHAFFGTLSDNKNVDGFSKTLDELDKRFPNSPSVAKARIVEEMRRDSSSEDELLEKIEPLLDKAINLNPEDIDLTSLDMYIGYKSNEKDYDLSLNEYNKNYPDSGLGIYYQAAKAWKNNKLNLAKNLIRKSLTKEPNNQRYKTSLDTMLKPENGKDPFFYMLSFGSEDF